MRRLRSPLWSLDQPSQGSCDITTVLSKKSFCPSSQSSLSKIKCPAPADTMSKVPTDGTALAREKAGWCASNCERLVVIIAPTEVTIGLAGFKILLACSHQMSSLTGGWGDMFLLNILTLSPHKKQVVLRLKLVSTFNYGTFFVQCQEAK